ncbi:hypothetical protein E5288_WYG007798 [Bos mutus]|uniref:Uncharacterized protein n=1 Tax=Bos mutus TaxID=72004 RepID=A0A6B0RAT8_9CETA|nr:hypothetical protein [Bos mutus]
MLPLTGKTPATPDGLSVTLPMDGSMPLQGPALGDRDLCTNSRTTDRLRTHSQTQEHLVPVIKHSLPSYIGECLFRNNSKKKEKSLLKPNNQATNSADFRLCNHAHCLHAQTEVSSSRRDSGACGRARWSNKAMCEVTLPPPGSSDLAELAVEGHYFVALRLPFRDSLDTCDSIRHVVVIRVWSQTKQRRSHDTEKEAITAHTAFNCQIRSSITSNSLCLNQVPHWDRLLKPQTLSDLADIWATLGMMNVKLWQGQCAAYTSNTDCRSEGILSSQLKRTTVPGFRDNSHFNTIDAAASLFGCFLTLLLSEAQRTRGCPTEQEIMYVFKYPTGTDFTRLFHFLGVAATQQWLASPEGKPEPSGMKGSENALRRQRLRQLSYIKYNAQLGSRSDTRTFEDGWMQIMMLLLSSSSLSPDAICDFSTDGPFPEGLLLMQQQRGLSVSTAANALPSLLYHPEQSATPLLQTSKNKKICHPMVQAFSSTEQGLNTGDKRKGHRSDLLEAAKVPSTEPAVTASGNSSLRSVMNGLLTGPRSQAAHSCRSVENQGDPGSGKAVTSLLQPLFCPAFRSPGTFLQQPLFCPAFQSPGTLLDAVFQRLSPVAVKTKATSPETAPDTLT